MDPAKLKVVELRAELSKRGLDSKGNKPALVKRLKEALEEELKQDLPDTSIGDTSTEDLDNSQATEQSITEEANVPDKEHEKTDPQCAASQQEHNTDAEVTETADNTGEKMEIEEAPPLEAVTKEPEPEPEPEQKSDAQPEPESELEETQELKIVDQSEEKEINSNMEENKENGEQDEPKSRKSRWGTEVDSLEATEEEIQSSQAESVDVPKVDKDAEPKGEKRRRSSPSPDRSQRRRSKSPIKEDEPPIDNDKVQLSWYDSDLHLQLDKESFLSAKPYHEGAFGYAWAGVRATHGVSAGKVCFEVKITEELKWEDLSKYYDKHRRDQYKSFSKHKTDDDKKKSEEELKNKGDDHKNENIPPENGENSENAPEDVPEVKKTAENEAVDECKREHVETPKIEESEKEMMETDEPEKQVEADENKSQTEPDENKSPTELDENKKQIGEDEIGKQTEINEAKMQTENQEELTNKELGEPIPTHLFRVGWSLLDTGLQLGEDKYSYGYESSGRFVINKQFQNYGIQFGVGDVVASFLNITESGISISYSVNGVSQSEAVSIPLTDVPENFALFPHVLSRNCAFQLNLGSQEESWFAKPEEFNDYEFLDKVESKIAGPARPENRNDCEVILMCGLPAAGKTHWVREYVQSNPDKKYTLLGNTHLLEKMTVSGDALKTKFKGSWNILLDKLQKCLNKLIEIAALRRRNYIIDQVIYKKQKVQFYFS
jgi:heterogeneous nuclear ribonucleoprotein U-like protein 1